MSIKDLINGAFDKRSGGGRRKTVRQNLTVRMTEEQRAAWGMSPGVEFQAWDTPDGILLKPGDPPLTKLYIEPSTRCNLHCRTCIRNTWEEPEGIMDMELFRELISSLSRVRTFRAMAFWGFGEPLTHPDIVEMVSLAKGIGADTELITNAQLLDSNVAEALIGAGLDTIVVSVDGAHDEAFSDIRPGGELSLVKRNIENLFILKKKLGKKNPGIGIEHVVMKKNLHELPKLPGLAKSLHADFIIVTNVLPYTEELKDEILYWLSTGGSYPAKRSGNRPEIIMPRIDSRKVNRGPLLETMMSADTLGYKPAKHLDVEAHCPFIWDGSAAVSWDGSLSPCVALMHTHSCYILDKHKTIKRHIIGNIGESSITSLWNREDYRAFRKKVRDFDFSPCVHCGGCDFSETNEEDCFGNTFPVCGDCLWARGVVICP